METLDSYDFDLPDELIAKRPLADLSQDRLLVLKKDKISPIHDQFHNVANYLESGDVLIVNNTKVRKAKFYARKPSGGQVEILLIKPLEKSAWEALIFGKGTLQKNAELRLENLDIAITVMGQTSPYGNIYEISCPIDLELLAERHGEIPLPPYFKRRAEPEDEKRYQTLFASRLGAVASPTASLHFTKELLDNLHKSGIQIAEITLHVGPGTFVPIRTSQISKHAMHREVFELTESCAKTLNQAKKEGRRIIAVGTTSMRVLEHAMINARKNNSSQFFACGGETSLFIRPGFRFLACNAIITNFHVPRSTLFVLACAVAGYDRVVRAYKEAIEQKYRFYSYGDACLFEIYD